MSQKTIETVVSSLLFTLFIFSAVIGWSLFIFLLTTKFWWIDVLYAGWLFIDMNTPECGGRRSENILNSKVWSYCKEYLSSKVILVPDFNLQPTRNYLFCCFPHGIIPLGPFLAFVIGVCDFRTLYPNFKVHITVIRLLLLTPYMRELALGIGLISCSETALNSVLSRPEGGNVAILTPGGAAEAYYCRSGVYKFILKRRKGFLRVALKNGVPLVPVITFGENDVFQQVENKWMMGLQKSVRNKIGFAPVLFYGRGFRENWYGWFPQRTKLMTVVGKPIEVCKTENPTPEHINELHGVFVRELVDLFETYKHNFFDNSENVFLELE